MQLVLSLFPGIGLLDLAFEQEGFCVVRGPDVLWGGDIRRFHPPAGKFEGIIGGPPCQAFSRLVHMIRHNGNEPKFGNLIPEFERCVEEAQPLWFLMENVPDAPCPQPQGFATWSTLLNNRQCFDPETGEPATQNRLRRWTFGDRRTGSRTVLMIETAALENPRYEYAALGGSTGSSFAASGWDGYSKTEKRRIHRKRPLKTIRRNGEQFRELCRKQGLAEDFDLPAFKMAEKCRAVGNGVPLPMGRALARAVREAVDVRCGEHVGL